MRPCRSGTFFHSAYERAGEAPNIDLRGEGAPNVCGLALKIVLYFANTGPRAEPRLGLPKGQPDRRTGKHATGEHASEQASKHAREPMRIRAGEGAGE